METVNRYQISIPGHDPATQRASISLLGAGGMRSALGRVHFYDAAAELPADHQTDGIVHVHLPLAAFAGVVAMLQHDSPIKVGFEGGRGKLITGEWEQAGETELLRK